VSGKVTVEDLGFVGEPDAINPEILHTMMKSEIIPVIAPIGVDETGITYNINADTVAGALVVCQREEDIESFSLPNVRVIVRADLQMNEAITAGVEIVRADQPMAHVASLPGDLPYLRSSELDVALRHAAGCPRAVVGDRDAQGTTLLTARGGTELAPAYGAHSLLRHKASGAAELSTPTWSGLRRDVDRPADLVPGPALGQRTRAMLEHTPELKVPA